MNIEQHIRLASIVGCSSDDGSAEVDQVEMAYERLKKHDCNAWRDEGLGCKLCNPIAQQIETINNFQLTKEEVQYLVNNIQHEYLGKETYYFATNLFNRMEKFLKEYEKK